jgi:Ca2+-binding RTX toxin-like protein
VAAGTGNDTLNASAFLTSLALDGGAGDDSILGGQGTDIMAGGDGDDIFIVNNAGDIVSGGSGTDKVFASVSYEIADDVENLELTGSSDISATGNAENNTLIGNAGNNSLDGLGGDDNLIGGLGNDTYFVDSTNDKFIEYDNEGRDMVVTSVSLDLLDDNVQNGQFIEDMMAVDNADGIELFGNVRGNDLIGNNSSNLLVGEDGNDYLSGAEGDDYLFGSYIYDPYENSQVDTLTGGGGNDIFYLWNFTDLNYSKSGMDDYALITDFEIGNDKISFGTAEWSSSNLLPDGIVTGEAIYNGTELIAVVQTTTGNILTSANFI